MQGIKNNSSSNDTLGPKVVSSLGASLIPDYLQNTNLYQDKEAIRVTKKIPLFATDLSKSPLNNRPNAPPTLTLPSCFNLKTKSQWAELEPGNLQVSYSGLGKGSEIDSATVKGNFPISPACGIYYYEVKIINKGRDGYIGVGFTTLTNSQQRLPGIDDKSWGYHSSDGKKYNASPTGVVYGPSFSTGDIVGCCINFANLSISFTRNGIMLGVAWTNLKILEEVPIYPVAGLRTPGESVVANFGLEPFKFDISQYYQDEKERLWKNVQSTSLSKLSSPTTSVINSLIVEYLVRQGYSETATTLYDSSIKEADLLDETGKTFQDHPASNGIENRKKVYELIGDGKILESLQVLTTLYPEFVTNYPIIHYQLLCLRFVEIIRCNLPTDNRDVEMHTPSSDHMESGGIEMQSVSILDAIKLAQEIKTKIRNGPKVILEAVEEIISLACYVDALDSPMAYILDLNLRQCVGELVNSAIIEMQGFPVISPLEKLFKQTLAVESLLSDGGGKVALFSVMELISTLKNA